MIRTLSVSLLLVAALLVASVPVLLHAQSTPTPGFKALTEDAQFEKLFGTVSAGKTSTTDLTSFINGAFKMLISIGGILAVLRIAYAGYQYMSSDAWGEKSHAKEILGDVVIGLLLLLSVWLILYQINPQILELKIKGVTAPAPNATAPKTK